MQRQLNKRYVAFVSFGKDSTAMLLLLLENNMPLDQVVFFDTGKEFKCIYDMRDRLIPLIVSRGIKFTELKPYKSFDYYMFEHKKKNGQCGYGWCGQRCRWFTGEKLKAFKPYQTENTIEYVGIALDETDRLNRLPSNKISPLQMFGYTESMCLEYCYNKGYIWYEGNIRLYDILDRVSCWCCANKSLKELYQYKLHLPDYYNLLLEYEKRIGPMKRPYYLPERLDWYVKKKAIDLPE